MKRRCVVCGQEGESVRFVPVRTPRRRLTQQEVEYCEAFVGADRVCQHCRQLILLSRDHPSAMMGAELSLVLSRMRRRTEEYGESK